MSARPALPWLLIALDVFGTLLLVAGILGLSGVDFGFAVLSRVAPGFIIFGALLMLPFIVWAVRVAVVKK